MAIAKKHRRILNHDGRAYTWFVRGDDDGGGSILFIQSETKTLSVEYTLGQKEDLCVLKVSGSEFVRSDPESSWRRFQCPRFDPHGVITPKGVAAIIQWCLSPTEIRIPANYSWGGVGSPPDVDGYRKSLVPHES